MSIQIFALDSKSTSLESTPALATSNIYLSKQTAHTRPYPATRKNKKEKKVPQLSKPTRNIVMVIIFMPLLYTLPK